ncbi:MAG TPA: type 4a pilus biogenesis protein PilO [Pyrinomonadaceae bacterium]
MKFGKLPNLPWYLRLVVFVAVAGVLYAGFWYLVTRGTRAETKAMQDEIAQLLPRNAQAQIAAQRLNEFRAVYKARQEEYAELQALLPEQRELTMVLQGIQDRARANGLVLARFNPKEDVQQDNYNGKKIEVGVISSFAGLRSFFEALSRYQRIVSVTNFELKQLDKQSATKTVDARFDLTAYYVSAERLQGQQPVSPVPANAPAGGPAPTQLKFEPAKVQPMPTPITVNVPKGSGN